MTEHEHPGRHRGGASTRIGIAIASALAFAAGVYLLLDATQPASGLVSFSFLLILPAAISAVVCYAVDIGRTRSMGQYLMIPVWILLAVVAASAIVLREGVICIVLLAPLWLVSGIAGAALTYRLRHRTVNGRTYCTTLLLLPLIAMQIEPMIPLPVADVGVSRSIVVQATPATLWPLLRGIPDVKPGEGSWNISQDVLGIPRPVGARMVGDGIGADRLVDWGARIRFRERITQWSPGSRIGWRFIFDDIEGWAFTDRHLMPNSAYFQVTTGGYTVEPLSGGRSRLTLDVRYRVQTPVNAYSRAWGEFFLGDIENNLLALVKQRAERP